MNFLWIATTRQKFWYWLKSQVVGPTYYKKKSLKQLKVANKVDNFTKLSWMNIENMASDCTREETLFVTLDVLDNIYMFY